MRIAVIVPRYGAEVVGGAEQAARGLAEAAALCGWKVEVWTTCAASHYDWKNVHRLGDQEIRGVHVRRFPITQWDPDRRAQLEFRLQMLGTLPLQDQYAWLDTGAHSAPLYRHIAQHAREFDVLIALPYPMPLSHYAAWSAPERTILWPCLHDEPYAYMEIVRLLMESVSGVVFNSPEERNLALKVLGSTPRRSLVLGLGVDSTLCSDGARVDGTSPVLYIGRLEQGKNVHLLYEYFRRYSENGGKIRLVVIGDGPLTPPEHPAFEYRGFVSEEDKARLCASSLALCQPSVNESFSLTIMEAWLNGRPALVNADCPVTSGHVRRCDGGLEFRDYDEFVTAIEWLQGHPDLAARMGANGCEYVKRNYTWDAVLARFERTLLDWKNAPTAVESTGA